MAQTTTHWTTAWNEHIGPLLKRRRILLACDFDGTISPLAQTPEAAHLPARTRILLQKLASCEGLQLALVSGRELSDLKAKVNLPGVAYCGNHGMQIELGEDYWECSEALSYRGMLVSVVNDLRHATAALPGVLIEDKVFTVSIHWRMVSPENHERLRLLVEELAAKYAELRLTYGKAVWELRPPVATSKGTALTYLLAKAALPVEAAMFLGDDHTDEAAFRALEKGTTIRVGPDSPTLARFRANDVPDAGGFLFCFYLAWSGPAAKHAAKGTTHGVEYPHLLESTNRQEG